MDYATQLAAKEQIVTGSAYNALGIHVSSRAPPLSSRNPQPYGYRAETELTPTPVGGLGYWSPFERQVIPIVTCPILQPDLLALWQDVDLDLPGLRKLPAHRRRRGVAGGPGSRGCRAARTGDRFSVSVAIVLPDQTAATLVGDNYTIQSVAGQDFRVSPGCYVYPSPALLAPIVETVLHYAALTGTESVIDAYSGVGILTAFLARQAAGRTM
ncbi:MAG: hypothetical protein H6661_07190 [Ardenticatenaceae bacterium]|nr:hypothetical protein [Ardenticatenaceae bacterium]